MPFFVLSAKSRMANGQGDKIVKNQREAHMGSTDRKDKTACFLIESSFPNVAEAPVSWGKHNAPAETFKAIVNPWTKKVYSIVSNDYKLIRHEDAIEYVEGELHKYSDFKQFETETDLYNDGGRMRRKYRFTDIQIDIRPNDYVHPELQLFNSYDVSWPLFIVVGAFRFVCANGLVVGKKFLQMRKRHIIELDRMDIDLELKTAIGRIENQATQWKEWATTPLPADAYEQTMKTMKFGKKALAIINDKVAGKKTGGDPDKSPELTIWAFYNILTWYITHRGVSLNHRVELERRLRVAMDSFSK